MRRTETLARVLTILAAIWALGGAAVADEQPISVTTKYGESRAYFQDWLAACRPGGYCSVISYVGNRGHLSDYWLRVESPEPDAELGVIYTPVAVPPADNQTLFVSVDGAPFVRLDAEDAEGWKRQQGDSLNELRFSRARAAEFVPQMKAGRFMIVSFTSEEGQTVAPRFSLRGLTAALRWIETARLP